VKIVTKNNENIGVFIHLGSLWFVNCTPQTVKQDWVFLPDAFMWDMMEK
jgi:hypothetical protein